MDRSSAVSTAGPEVLSIGKDVLSDQVFVWVTDAERNKPYIKGFSRDAFGRWKGDLVTGEGWRNLKDLRITKGAALSADEKKVFENAYRYLTSRQPGRMDKRTVVDVSLTEIVARLHPRAAKEGLADILDQIPLGPWAINGFKWFSSKTDSEMTIMLARTPAGVLSTSNTIPRLKNKFGTQALPTVKLVLENTRGWLIGQERQGVEEISSILTLTRIHSTVAAVGSVGRGLAIARAYSLVREVGAGNQTSMKLLDSPLHMRILAKLSAEYHLLMLVTFYASSILGVSEHGPISPHASHRSSHLRSPEKLIEPLLQIMTQLAKAYVCKASVALLFSYMEALGGLGYLYNEEQEYLSVSRVFRDTALYGSDSCAETSPWGAGLCRRAESFQGLEDGILSGFGFRGGLA
ncbi:hypothetical protein E4U31_000907 [Claviceps sp. LM219 group G6]|nr:hypothetical protein E4U31_000907 [Claviceps sp. LM219 group G6]